MDVLLLIDQGVRAAAVGVFGASALVAGTHWLVRRRTLSPFGAWPRLVRRVSDPVLVPLERRLLRAGQSPQDAPMWLLGLSLVLGLVAIGLLGWFQQTVMELVFLQGAGPRAWVVRVVDWSFRILEFALLVRVIGSWIGVGEYNRWMRPVVFLTEWMLAPLRRVLPTFGMIDLSPLVAYFGLQLLRTLVVRMLA